VTLETLPRTPAGWVRLAVAAAVATASWAMLAALALG
jgi:hypothetical protein